MRQRREGRRRRRWWPWLLAAVVSLVVIAGAAAYSLGVGGLGRPGFGKSTLKGEASDAPTSLQFGPDGRLYVAQIDGMIKAYEVTRAGPDDYRVSATETIDAIQSIPNHDDDGSRRDLGRRRLVTGMLVSGSAQRPVIHVTSGDPRVGGGASGADKDLDTNSGVLSRLTRTGDGWRKVDLVAGLPRSEENHSANGMALSRDGASLFVAVGGNTNAGAPSTYFANLPQYALSSAVLAVDLDAIGDTPYRLPTLDDEDRRGRDDRNDPFGGNDGKNQASVVRGGPVSVYAPGFRNPYDILMTTRGRLYSVDNGGNPGWGDVPIDCSNAPNQGGPGDEDDLMMVTRGFYGGTPNPTRANPDNTFNASNPQSPVTRPSSVECRFEARAITSFDASTNGLTEYTAANFDGDMKGDLLAAGYNNIIHRIALDDSGRELESRQELFTNVDKQPLDVTVGSQPLAGTIWVGDIQSGNIWVFEPEDAPGRSQASCDPGDDGADEDGDRYSNADERANETNPCSAGDRPMDSDGDLRSDLIDADDDNDGLPDVRDPFAIDARNGMATEVPLRYSWENDAPEIGGLLELGFTGLMTNGRTNYRDQFVEERLTVRGAAGVVTVGAVPPGDALGGANTQEYGFQLGVDPGRRAFTAHTRIVSPFADLSPSGGQSLGLFVGTGDQDNYVKLGAAPGGLRVVGEVAGRPTEQPLAPLELPGPDYVDLYLTLDPERATVQASYAATTDAREGSRRELGEPVEIPREWLEAQTAPAVGIISTSVGARPFPATWDSMEVTRRPPRR